MREAQREWEKKYILSLKYSMNDGQIFIPLTVSDRKKRLWGIDD